MKASVIIPSYNACERLYLNLVSLKLQNVPTDAFEVIVIDNGSKDETYQMLTRFDADYQLKIVRIDNNMGRAYARNCGIKQACGDLIIFHDSDMLAAPQYIKDHLSSHDAPGKVVCGASWKRIFSYYYAEFAGKTRQNFIEVKYKYPVSGKQLSASKRVQLIQEKQISDKSFMSYAFDMPKLHNIQMRIIEKYGQQLEDYSFPWRFFITNNCSVEKSAIIDAGLFDENFISWGCEDLDLGYRLFKKGYIFRQDNEILSIHQEHPEDVKYDMTDNVIYFTKKYDTIDLLLFYFGKYITQDENEINQIALEASIIEKSEKYKELLMLFLNMMKTLREIHLSKLRIPIYQSLMQSNQSHYSYNILRIKSEYQEVKQTANFTSFSNAFSKLLKLLHQFDIDA